MNPAGKSRVWKEGAHNNKLAEDVAELLRTHKAGAAMMDDLDAILLYLDGSLRKGRIGCGGAAGFGVEVLFMRHISLHIFILHKTLAVFNKNHAARAIFFFVIRDVLRLT